jgi:TolA-binding protein
VRNFKNVFLTFAVSGPLLLSSGCIVTQSDVGVLKTQIAALNKTLQDVQRNQVSVDQQMEDVTIQLTQAADNLNQFDYKLDAISTKLDNISSVLNAKDSAPAMLPGEIYEEAKKQFDAEQYSLAISGFSLYIKNAPEGQNIEEAYLYLSESYLNTRENQKAAVAVATLLDKYPQSQYTAAARVLYARTILPLGKKDEASNYLRSVMQDFKNTLQAEEAQKLLKDIK